MSEATDVTLNRERGIGGSDESIIMGLSPFKTRWQLLREKVGLEENTFTGSVYTRYGDVMEPKIRDYINKELMDDPKFEPNYTEIKRTDLNDYYHADGYSEDALMVLEIKTTSDVVSEFDAVEYDMPYRDFALRHYKRYLVQLVKGMYMNEVDRGLLAVYERPEDMSEEFDPDRLSLFMVDQTEMAPILQEVLESDEAFRADYLYLKEHPDAKESELPSRQALVDISHDECRIGNLTVSALFLITHKKEITDMLKAIEGSFKDAMEERNIKSVTLPDGSKISYVAKQEDKTVEVFDEEAFQKDYPDIYSKYMKLVTKKGRTGFVKVQVKKK